MKLFTTKLIFLLLFISFRFDDFFLHFFHIIVFTEFFNLFIYVLFLIKLVNITVMWFQYKHLNDSERFRIFPVKYCNRA